MLSLFARKDQGSLPMAASTYSHGDGSGKAIRMDAPIVRSWKNASAGTKGSYYAILASVFFIIFGYRHLRHNHASIWLTCYTQDCTLDITPNGRKGTTSITFHRKQLKKAQSIKVDKYGNFIKVDDSPVRTSSTSRGKKKNKDNSRGPDENGHYDSYSIHLQPPRQNDGSVEEDFVELHPISSYVYPSKDGTNQQVLSMRKFNLGQSKRRTRTMVTKIDSYIKERRHKLTLKENAGLSWQGILMLVMGIFGLLMAILLGHFWDDDSKSYNKQRRRGVQQAKTKKKSGDSKPSGPRYSGYPQQRPLMNTTARVGGSSNNNMRYRSTSGKR